MLIKHYTLSINRLLLIHIVTNLNKKSRFTKELLVIFIL